MNLTIDIGNTSVKTAIFKGNSISKAIIHSSFTISTLKKIVAENPDIENVVLCTVRDYPKEWRSYLNKFHFIELTEKTPVPIKNAYLTPSTLGKDRLAAAVGANAIYPGKNILSITAGTCIIYDLVTKGVYKGGAISPGLYMRFHALHTFTDKLPLVEANTNYRNLVGRNTEESIRSGVQQGMVQEIKGVIKAYKGKYPDLQIIMSGGSLSWLRKSIKEKINPQPFLALKGLNVILTASLEKKKA
ncbi:MAG TPA: type III pantothenate kinase [Bacteroidia bacterium]|nr:type III pantothenate kinase [Bacteroidia bacterium]